jgi:hypothetical protein
MGRRAVAMRFLIRERTVGGSAAENFGARPIVEISEGNYAADGLNHEFVFG